MPSSLVSEFEVLRFSFAPPSLIRWRSATASCLYLAARLLCGWHLVALGPVAQRPAGWSMS